MDALEDETYILPILILRKFVYRCVEAFVRPKVVVCQQSEVTNVGGLDHAMTKDDVFYAGRQPDKTPLKIQSLASRQAAHAPYPHSQSARCPSGAVFKVRNAEFATFVASFGLDASHATHNSAGRRTWLRVHSRPTHHV